MIRSLPIKTLFLFFFIISLGSAQKKSRYYAKPTLAVMNFDSSGISDDIYTFLYNKFWYDLDSIGVFIMVEQHQVYDILEKYQYDRPECTTKACAIEMGRLVGIQNVIIGSFFRSGDSSSVKTEIIIVDEDSIKYSSSGSHVGEIDGLIPHVQIAALRLSGIEPSDRLLIKAGLLEEKKSENSFFALIRKWIGKAQQLFFRKEEKENDL